MQSGAEEEEAAGETIGVSMVVLHAFEGDPDQSLLTVAAGETVQQIPSMSVHAPDGWVWVRAESGVMKSGAEGYQLHPDHVDFTYSYLVYS